MARPFRRGDMSRTALIVAALATLAGLGVLWFLHNYDRVPVRETTGMSGEARRNPFLALERLSERMGVPARELRTPAHMAALPERGLLVLPALRDALGERERAGILKWVEQGGHLVVQAEQAGRPDPLLDALGVQRRNVALPSGLKGAEAQPRYTWPDDDKPLAVSLASSTLVSHPRAKVTLSWRDRPALVEFTQGKGRVTVVSSLSFARNELIGRQDNAEFAWRIIDTQPPPVEVIVFNRPQAMSLARWLLTNAWPALAGIAVLVLLWLARVVPRFGPVAPDPQPARRRLLDHLRAAGRFQWSAGRGGRLVEAAREAALRRLARAHPEFGGLAPRERERYLVEVLGLDAQDARRVVAGEAVRGETDLVRTIGLYQWVHERLAAARRPR
jgi:hypothetical protein